jgi:menaquinone-specific isochorismate synthase
VVIVAYNSLDAFIQKGISEASRLKKPILVSKIVPINTPSPLSLFTSTLAQCFSQRFFWSTPAKDLECVGLGAAAMLRAQAHHRYDEIEAQWQSILKDSLIDPASCQTGTGPLLFGGFSFDPLQAKENHWHLLGDGLFILPRYLLSVIEGQTWLTLNVMIGPEDNHARICEQLEEEISWFTSPFEELSNRDQRKTRRLKSDPLEDWIARVEKVSERIQAGVIEKVVLARELMVQADADFDLEQIVKTLYQEQPMTYVFALQMNDVCFVGASPEQLIKKQQDDILTTCLAGSIPRGTTPVEDDKLGLTLLQDPKNLHEHEIVVRMIKQLMDTVCHDVHAPSQPSLYKAKYIQHLYTPVAGRSNGQFTLLRMVENFHPTPALGGYPREYALPLIRNTENFDRGWYASPIGWIDHQGQGEFSVGIRSALLQGNEAYLYAGCGIVKASDPLNEYKETQIKFRTMLSVLGGEWHGDE